MKRSILSALMLTLGVGLVATFLFVASFSAKAQPEEDNEETLREQTAALAAESSLATAPLPFEMAPSSVITAPLFIGVDDAALSTYRVNPVTANAYPAFTGFQVWGAAFDKENNRIFFNNGATLYEWPVGSGTVNTLGTIVDAGANAQVMVSLAFYDGTLYGTKNIANEAVWSIDTTTLIASVYIDYEDADYDFGGLAVDPKTGMFYGTNDDTAPFGSGLFRINMDGTATLIAPYPDGQTDIDGLAISPEGFAYLVTDEPGNTYVYDFNASAYTTPIPNPWTTSEIFSRATWIYGSLPNATPSPIGSTQLSNEIVFKTLTISNPTATLMNWTFSETVPLAQGPSHPGGYEPLPYLPDPDGNAANRGRGSREISQLPLAYRWEPAGGSSFNGRVLVFSDDFTHSPDFAPLALEALQMGYTYQGSFTGFANALNAESWDIVIFANEASFPSVSALNALHDYVQDGGTLIMHSWAISTTASIGTLLDHPLWATMGVTITENIGGNSSGDSPQPVYWWTPSHPFFVGVPEFTTLDTVAWFSHGQKFEPLPGFEALAGYTTPGPDAGAAALVVGNDGRTIMRGFLDAANSADLDADTVYDGLELWIKMLAPYLPCGVSWASVNPAAGSTPANATSDVTVTFDSTGLGRGLHTGFLCLETDYSAAPLIQVPITMNVLGPEVLLNKTVGTAPALCSPYNDVTIYGAGAVTYCYQIWNTGDVTLTHHTLVDDQLGTLLENFAYTLPPGASVHITETAFIQGAAVLTNTATWTADDGEGRFASASDEALVYMIEPRLVAVEAANDSPTLQGDLTTLTATAYITQNLALFTEDFEGGLGDWTATGLWHLETELDLCGSLVAPFPSSSQSAYFGNGFCTFSETTAVSGTLDLNSPITLETGTAPTLSFWTYEETECGGTCDWDQRLVQISTNGGISWTTVYTGGLEGYWNPVSIDLSAYEGNAILLRFFFDSVDDLFNDYFGWMVDDIQITTNEVITVPAPAANVIYAWDFGDGATGTGAVTTHNYPPGVYDAVITAYNSAGAITATTVVTVIQTEWNLYLPIVFGESTVGAAGQSVSPLAGWMPGLALAPLMVFTVGLHLRRKR